MRTNLNWSWILIAAALALMAAIWLPSRRTAHFVAPRAYVFPDENPAYVPPMVDNDTRLSPFPERPGSRR